MESSASAARPSSPAPRLELRGITKAYPSVVANDRVSLKVAPGEIHAVLGENGAGKSTLMKIIYGVTRADQGEVLWEGVPVSVTSPAHARRLGIGMVFQHFSLFDTLSVEENIALALERRDCRGLAARIRQVSQRYGLPLDPRRLVHLLSVGERQRVEIVRCLLQNPRLLIMDEPTSVLTPQAVQSLFETLRRLSAEGLSILYISHKLEEIRALCHSATVLRGGRVTGTADPREETASSLARMMIGAELPVCQPRAEVERGAAELEIDSLSCTPDDPFATPLRNISLTVHRGEVVGVAGISGNGQSELLAALSGEQPLARTDAIRIGGRPVGTLGPAQRRRLGMVFVPEERLGRGAVPDMTLTANALLTANRTAGMVRRGLVDFGRVREFARRCIRDFNVKCGGTESTARSLSGGNLQKFIVAREMLQAPHLLIVSQPTWGVDVGAAAQIRQALLDLRDGGGAVLVVSEELDELFEICDRIAVIAGGRMSAARPRAETTREEVGLLMGGSAQDADGPGRESDREVRHATA